MIYKSAYFEQYPIKNKFAKTIEYSKNGYKAFEISELLIFM